MKRKLMGSEVFFMGLGVGLFAGLATRYGGISLFCTLPVAILLAVIIYMRMLKEINPEVI